MVFPPKLGTSKRPPGGPPPAPPAQGPGPVDQRKLRSWRWLQIFFRAIGSTPNGEEADLTQPVGSIPLNCPPPIYKVITWAGVKEMWRFTLALGQADSDGFSEYVTFS